MYMPYVFILICTLGAARAVSQCPNKTELDHCLGKMAPRMPKTGLPVNKEQLCNMCIAFKGGMRCVDAYTQRCMSALQREALEEHLKGARSTLAFLCDDPVFQREYLSHGPCMEEVGEDWEKCNHHFKHLVNQQHLNLNITQDERDHNICCIRAGFLSCVYGMSYLKCGKIQAVFLKKVSATLSYSDIQQEKCRNVTLRTCSAAPASALLRGRDFPVRHALVLFLCLLLLVAAGHN